MLVFFDDEQTTSRNKNDRYICNVKKIKRKLFGVWKRYRAKRAFLSIFCIEWIWYCLARIFVVEMCSSEFCYHNLACCLILIVHLYNVHMCHSATWARNLRSRSVPTLKIECHNETQYWKASIMNEVRQFCRYQYVCQEILFHGVSSDFLN